MFGLKSEGDVRAAFAVDHDILGAGLHDDPEGSGESFGGIDEYNLPELKNCQEAEAHTLAHAGGKNDYVHSKLIVNYFFRISLMQKNDCTLYAETIVATPLSSILSRYLCL